MKNTLLTLLAWHLGLAALVAQPVITNQPQNQTNIDGTTAMFTVGATGAPPLSYQWRSHANPSSYTNIPFGTEATLVLTNVQPTPRRFGVVVTDAGGLSVTSSPLVTLTVRVPPSITLQPTNRIAEVGDTVTFTAAAAGDAPLAYQWRMNNTNLPGKTNLNLVLSNVQFSNAGPYSVVITNVAGSITSQIATLTVGLPIFTRVTNGPVATDTGYSWACAWADCNNDGWIDLLVANEYNASSGRVAKTRLYVNQGDGTFVRATNAATTTGGPTIGVAWGDIDNDGHLDLFVANATRQTNFLFRNTGNGDFTRITNAPVVTESGRFHGGAWGDFDNDGWVDLFVAAFRTPDEIVTAPNFLYRNLGGDQFSRVAYDPLAPTNRNTSSSSVSWCDFDNDGYLDLFIANGGWTGSQNNELHRNDGHGAFTRLTNAVPAKDGGNSESSAWGDFDNDGLPDLFVANVTSLGGPKNFLYRNLGGGAFDRILSGPVVNEPAGINSIGCAWADYDNDGWLDLFVANGEYSSQNNFLYHNNGDGSFTKIGSGLVVNDGGGSAGCAWGDYDNDGFLDLFVSNYDDGTATPQKNMLYHNEGNSNAWLNIRLIGTVSNRAAIGAKARLHARLLGQPTWQLREVIGGSGFGSQNDLRLHFGLGDATNVETLRLEWPSGTVQELHNVAPKQILTITEPPRLTATRISGQPQFTLKGGRNMNYGIEASANLRDWSPVATVTVTNLNGTAPVLDTNAPGAHRFYRAVIP